MAEKSLEAQKARNAAKKAKELVRRKNAFSVGGLPGKLADCSEKDPALCEIYFVELSINFSLIVALSFACARLMNMLRCFLCDCCRATQP
jgi:hypothetical protein